MSEDSKKYWTGVGSRSTPEHILMLMKDVAQRLGSLGYTLRSGGADGADIAFEYGSDDANGNKEIYIPWDDMKTDHGRIYRHNGRDVFKFDLSPKKEDAMILASEIHPAWDRCSQAAQKLHARNMFQVLGYRLDTPSKFLICYAIPQGDSVKGGTRTAFECAKKHGIPVFNMYREDVQERFIKYLDK